MTATLSDGYPRTTAGGDYAVVPDDGVVALGDLPTSGSGTALDALVAQELEGARRERVPDQVGELLRGFGFGWETRSEPGHMRAVGPAAALLRLAYEHAATTAAAVFDSLDIPCVTLDGVSVVDAADPVVAGYMTLTSGVPGLYGDGPYAIGRGDDRYVLRQTGCLQKFAVCRDRRLASAALPSAIFEISDSFRREAAETLQLGSRLRRFHLPEAHVHCADRAAAVETSLALHQPITALLADIGVEFVMLVTARQEFVAAHPDYATRLVQSAAAPALIRVVPAGRPCQDGVEVDVEYKVVDSTGTCRELSTFQIDEEITRRFGVRCDDGSHPATIHTVLTGSLERYLYTVVDRIARGQAEGLPQSLPMWLSPVQARVLPSDATAVGAACELASRLIEAGLRADVDDRDQPTAQAVADADRSLVPALVLVGEDASGGRQLQARTHPSDAFRPRELPELVAELSAAARRPAPIRPARLSRNPFDDHTVRW